MGTSEFNAGGNLLFVAQSSTYVFYKTIVVESVPVVIYNDFCLRHV